MTLPAYTLRPSLRAALLTFLVHQNPFYLLSALSMLAGCYALNSGLAARTGDLAKLLALVGVLNIYELMLIALGIFLIRRRGIIRDGRTLLLLEAPFLVDLAFLNAEVGSVSVRMGCLLNLLVLGLALAKTAFVLHALWGRTPVQLLRSIAVQLAVLFLMPCVFNHFEHQGGVRLSHFYAAWWVIGALLIAYELQARTVGPDTNTVDLGLRLFIRRLYLALPLASIILHLSLLHWVYRIPFVAGDLSPLLLGGAFVLGRSTRAMRSDVKLLRAIMPLAALALTLDAPPLWHWQWTERVDFTPALLVCSVSYLTYVYCFFLSRAFQLLAGAAIAVLLVALGPTVAQLEFAASWAWQRAISSLQWLAGRTAIEWGLTAMASAFGFLALGALVSLRKEPLPEVAAQSASS